MELRKGDRDLRIQIPAFSSTLDLRPPPSPAFVSDLAASFQEAVVDCLVGKAMAALHQTGLRTLCVGGGVAANARFRQRLDEEAKRRDIELHIAPCGCAPTTR